MTIVYNATWKKVCRYYNLSQKMRLFDIHGGSMGESPALSGGWNGKKNRPRAQAARGRFFHGTIAAGDGREAISAGWGREGVRPGSFGK
jgi:hypothetical protein